MNWLVVMGIAAIAVSLLVRKTSAAKASGDAKTIAQLARAGSDLSKPHDMDFFFYCPTQAAAERIAPRLIAVGLSTEIERAAKGPDWVILGKKTMVPNVLAMETLTATLEAIAASEHGEYDGWGAEIVP